MNLISHLSESDEAKPTHTSICLKSGEIPRHAAQSD